MSDCEWDGFSPPVCLVPKREWPAGVVAVDPEHCPACIQLWAEHVCPSCAGPVAEHTHLEHVAKRVGA